MLTCRAGAVTLRPNPQTAPKACLDHGFFPADKTEVFIAFFTQVFNFRFPVPSQADSIDTLNCSTPFSAGLSQFSVLFYRFLVTSLLEPRIFLSFFPWNTVFPLLSDFLNCSFSAILAPPSIISAQDFLLSSPLAFPSVHSALTWVNITFLKKQY